MEPKDIANLAAEAINRASNTLGDNPSINEIAIESMGVSEEVVDAVMEYMVAAAHQHIFEHAISESEGMTPTDVIRHAVGVCVPTVLMLAREFARSNNTGTSDAYMTTVGAEIQLQTHIEEGRSLSEIWPTEYVTEIVDVFGGDANKTFLAGVMCGRNNG